jgi:hypothetical protein
MATAIMVGRDQAAGRLPGAAVLEVDSVDLGARQLRAAHDDVVLASTLGPFRRFNLAHPKSLIL